MTNEWRERKRHSVVSRITQINRHHRVGGHGTSKKIDDIFDQILDSEIEAKGDGETIPNFNRYFHYHQRQLSHLASKYDVLDNSSSAG